MRAPYQVLVLPYIIEEGIIRYAVLKRSDLNFWQGIAGGGEVGETILESAKRETHEEAGISGDLSFLQLDSTTSLPVEHVVGTFLWGEEVYVITEFSFGVELFTKDLILSKEHSLFKWLSYEEAIACLKWDSNKTALWELNQRLLKLIDNQKCIQI
ncbi:NUDIX pyrophosphatase [Bacillus sp. AFS002410]|uniref:NUDIX hydrolase n=1 Tax=Bacillus sp. AFS002410 TaxID=2033481 RepID=UPI000BEF540D|nr:NUDIX pyrophosphatase [Bacillus sp. AFS002410]PEJ54384.1 NUDIX pyrophosphatase [Bacillus sp. AFS002410]